MQLEVVLVIFQRTKDSSTVPLKNKDALSDIATLQEEFKQESLRFRTEPSRKK